MKLSETLLFAINSITSNKMRTMFTMFGIIVGIASVMLITSVGDGFRNTMHGFFEDMGLDEIQVFHTSALRPIERAENMTNDEAEFLRHHPNIMAVTTQSNVTFQNSVEILESSDMRAAQLQGRDQYFQLFSGPTLIQGRHISPQDIVAVANVAIINENTALAVFGTTYNIIGREIEIRREGGTISLTIIGLYESEDAFALGNLFELPFEIVVPISLVQQLNNLGTIIGNLVVRVYDTSVIHQMGDNIINMIEIRRGAEDIFNSFSMASALEETDAVIGVFTVFLTMVASISLIVGGIGVMNIMLVSVTERTREIGIRKSLGATRGNIVFQFLVEASVLTIVGGIAGVFLGYLGGLGVGRLAYILINMELVPSINFATITIIVLISGSIGLLFGVYPALKASKLDPVESLRFE